MNRLLVFLNGMVFVLIALIESLFSPPFFIADSLYNSSLLVMLRELFVPLDVKLAIIHVLAFCFILVVSIFEGTLHFSPYYKSMINFSPFDPVLLTWDQKSIQPWKQDMFTFLVATISNIMPFVFLVLPIYFVISAPYQSFIWIGISILLQPRMIGAVVARNMWGRKYTAKVGITKVGVFGRGTLYKWGKLGCFEADHREKIVRIRGADTSLPVLVVLQPPAPLFEHCINLLDQYLPSVVPIELYTYRQARLEWVIRYGAIFFLGALLALLPYFAPSRNLACIIIGIGFWLWMSLFAHLIRKHTQVDAEEIIVQEPQITTNERRNTAN